MGLDFGTAIGLAVAGAAVLDGQPKGILKPKHPSFSVHGLPGAAIGAPSNVAFPTVLYDLNGNYNPANGRFTAPVKGTYAFFGHVLGENGSTGDTRYMITLNGALYNGGYYITTRDGTMNGGWVSLFAGAFIAMQAGDYAAFYYAQGSALHTNGAYVAFGGYLIG
jgi:hypothetical protein